MLKDKQMPEIDAAIGKEDWKFLLDNFHLLAEAVSIRIDKGDSPDEIYRYVLRAVGMWRQPIALRCRHAAQFLLSEKMEGR